MWSLHVWKVSLENGNIAYTPELCDCPQSAFLAGNLSIAPLFLWCAKSLSWCHSPLPKLLWQCSGGAWGQGSQIGPEIKCGCRCCSDRERLQVSTVLEKPHPLTTILRRWGLVSLLGLLWASETFLFTKAEWQVETGYSINEYTLFQHSKRYCDTCKSWPFFLAKC